ncbi:hypothetical protein SAMN04488112_1257 [Melghirimyces thermohalophilus]|uniref:Uncharacterized protein n=1 Tax=Melghirimyces thermohalophilus TaxID=1236220 RepID=A0A1G6R0H8_9BACL|nr:hypothetical protein [Melghirimyces thermohalophilus]SDC97555.1 hypothetical protein SAMN04488112_1257 [Melghirimyces thermohalophilus]
MLFKLTTPKAAITGVDENGNKIGVGERLREAMVLPIAKPVKGVKMVAKIPR